LLKIHENIIIRGVFLLSPAELDGINLLSWSVDAMQLIDWRKYSGIYHSAGSFTRPVKKGYKPPSSLLAPRRFIIICFCSMLLSDGPIIIDLISSFL